MTTFEYLEEKLSFLAESFDITVKYHYDSNIYRHIVELTPQKEYYNNDKLDDTWIKISLEFMKFFPNDSISFVSNDSTLISNEHLLIFNAKRVQDYCINNFYTDFLNDEIKIDYVRHFDFNYNSQNLFNKIVNRLEIKSITFSEFPSIEINHNEKVNFNHEDYISNSSNVQLPQAA